MLRFAALCFVFVTLPLQASDLGLIKATGSGFADGSRMPGPQARLMAKRAATVDAQRQLVSTLKGVRVTAGTTVENMMVTSDQVGTRVQGMLQGAFEVDSNTTQEEGSWVSEVTLAVCMDKSPLACREKPTLASAVQPALPKPPPEVVFQPTTQEIEAAPEPVVPTINETAPAPANTPVTGLIVDVSGQDFSPLLDVRIRTDAGKELYGPGHVDEGTDWLHWAASMLDAEEMTDVVGESPMVVSVESLGRDSELIVSKDSAVSIFKSNLDNGDFLKQGKVIFIVGG